MLNPRQQVYYCATCRCMHLVGEKHSNKYNARKGRTDGHAFDSQAERRHYQKLLWREMAGEITNLVVHPRYEIIVEGKHIAWYTADFRYQVVKTGQTAVEDVKSEPTRKRRDYQLIKKLMWAVHHIRVIDVE